jgi:hypothetical protein
VGAKFRDLSAKCRDEGGECESFTGCNTVTHIYKGYCKTDYSQVCCVPRSLVCDSHDGICTDDPEACEAAGAIMGIKYQIQFKTWLTCNATHTCCRPMPQDKEEGMANFKAQFPEHTDESRERSAPAPAPTAAPVRAAVAIPSPAPARAFSFSPEEEEESPEERQAKVGEAVLAVLAENPSLSLKEAMQHPSVRVAAGEPAIPPGPVLAAAPMYPVAEDPALAQRRMQLAALRQRRRQLQRLRLQQQIRQAAAAREALRAQQQAASSIFPGHSLGGGDAIDSEIHKRLYSSGLEYPYARELPIDPHKPYEQPHPFNANNPGGENPYQFPYQKQGTDYPGSDYPGSNYQGPDYTPSYTHRVLGQVQMSKQPGPVPVIATPAKEEKFGFRDNEEFLKARENSFGKYYLGP